MPALSTLLIAALMAGCAVTQPNGIPERMLTPEAVQEATRQDANGEPYYLSYQVGETGLAAAFDDGSHTYVEFERPVPSDLSCFDNAGALLSCEAVGNVLAVEGTHAGILLRQGENASFIAPNPKALTPPPRQLGNTSAWAAHVQARNRVLLKAPLRQALERSAGVQADPNLNQAAGLRASMVQPVAPALPGAAEHPASAADRPGTRLLRHGETASHHATTNEPGLRARGSLKAERPDGAAAITPGTSARPGKPAGAPPATVPGPHNIIVSYSRWTSLPFADNSAQLDARHPVMIRLGKSLAQADEVRVEVLSSAEDALLAQARLAATRELLQRRGVISSRIRTSTRTLPTARSTQQGAAAPGQPTLRIQLLKDGLPLEAA
ncbi:hypothetical protein PPG32_07325 [Lautropia mirabilis]|uniref:hypothetical protein n=1 Tax=Lautropia mirabilis TaxID=47671 RepID=UPI00234B93B3|nr:hypothetical protein [Lautropia mirabilis]MDC6093912.1 hypothetical protein [Lautropia mirabilis]